jgi:class 3 adenylate cyclase
MDTFRRTASRADADAAGTAMERLQATTVTHLDHEEQETESALIQHDGDPVLKEMGKKFSRRVGIGKAGIFFAWVQDGATAQERSALAASVPRPVLAVIGGVFGRPYRNDVAPVWSD